ncbi:MAG: hypothetical protein HQL64_05740 [Magnetococcales bacterium]|nr:hypothetical protein [Magnetococcales bacterium]
MMSKRLLGLAVLAVPIAVTLIGCGGGGSGSGSASASGNSTATTAIFYDSPVSGLGYRVYASDGSISAQGVTDSQGSFPYLEGGVAQFFVGDIYIGSLKSGSSSKLSPSGFVSPEDIANDETKAKMDKAALGLFSSSSLNTLYGSEEYKSLARTLYSANIARLLIAVDEDSNPDNGMQIPANLQKDPKTLDTNGSNVQFPNLDFGTMQIFGKSMTVGGNEDESFNSMLTRMGSPKKVGTVTAATGHLNKKFSEGAYFAAVKADAQAEANAKAATATTQGSSSSGSSAATTQGSSSSGSSAATAQGSSSSGSSAATTQGSSSSGQSVDWTSSLEGAKGLVKVDGCSLKYSDSFKFSQAEAQRLCIDAFTSSCANNSKGRESACTSIRNLGLKTEKCPFC